MATSGGTAQNGTRRDHSFNGGLGATHRLTVVRKPEHGSELALRDLARTRSQSNCSLRTSYVVVVPMMRPAGDTDAVGHCVQFGLAVRDHVTQDSPSQPSAHIVNEDGHSRNSAQQLRPGRRNCNRCALSAATTRMHVASEMQVGVAMVY